MRPGCPQSLPPRPRRGWCSTILAALLALAAVLTVSGGATAIATIRGSGGATGAAFVGDLRPEVRRVALTALLERRAKAVRDRDRQAFLADVDGADQAFKRQQEQQFDNLTKLPLAEFRYSLEQPVRYDALIPTAVRDRYQGRVQTAAVTVLYRIDGVDTEPVAAPWVPIVGVVAGRWRLAGVASDGRLPTGTNGQAWETGEITVARSARVVLVLSAGDANRAPDLLRMAETGLDQVAAVRRGGWVGKVLITAVQDPRLFTTYFTQNPDHVVNVAAIAVPYYAEIPDWRAKPKYAATRVVFNPHEFEADPTELAHDLTHEFAHAAMGSVTTDETPLWLVEGFAEYVAYEPEQVPSSFVRRSLEGFPAGSTPPSANFYGDPRNYVLGWLACRMIVEKYGEARLLALYEASGSGDAVKQVLGIDTATLDRQYVNYVEKVRAG
ncbi:hypothetical protein HC028_08830 [Planosporangium flavigriseum]|uniref:Peptidase MA superfamily protein n=1 Tax=Planosporangium flavigriseum TaxID=373681 RepID=A0A8J3LJP2_9ACTN|nr:hypothetical protein [Planosporangium flavigriseum]NJC64609.1 hypothetical protein [Planosporangium flavigriseum]GIG71908.1 hypothetical protein Pfl04_03120 [Planosporangium flavigriseum]